MEGGVADPVVLSAALLHDTIEDTDTTPEELTAIFGADVAGLVVEMTDDKSLPKAERKRRQVEHAARLSARARVIKLADKVANVRDVTDNPPADWSLARRQEYLDWTERVVRGVRGASPELEACYDVALATGRAVLKQAAADAET